MHQQLVQQMMNVNRIMFAMEMYVKQIVIMIKIVYPMNVAFVEYVNRFVIVMHLVD